MSDVLELLCLNACLFHRGVLCLRTLSSYTFASLVTNSVWVDLQFTPDLYFLILHSNCGFEPGVLHYYTFCKASTTISTLLTSLFVI